VIGDRPVRFSIEETVVAQDTGHGDGFRYYDAAARYFRRLAEALPFGSTSSPLTAPGNPGRSSTGRPRSAPT